MSFKVVVSKMSVLTFGYFINEMNCEVKAELTTEELEREFAKGNYDEIVTGVVVECVTRWLRKLELGVVEMESTIEELSAEMVPGASAVRLRDSLKEEFEVWRSVMDIHSKLLHKRLEERAIMEGIKLNE